MPPATAAVAMQTQNDITAYFLQQAEAQIKSLLKKSIENYVKIGQILNDAKDRLPHGQYEAWVTQAFGWTPQHARDLRNLAHTVKRYPEVLNFTSIRAALTFAKLPADVREAALTQGVKTLSGLNRLDWRMAVEESVQEGTPEALGGVMEAIEQARTDPVLAPVAAEVYEEHRQELARLTGEPVAVLDREIRFTDPQPRPVLSWRPAEDLALCRWTGESWAVVNVVNATIVQDNSVIIALPDVESAMARAIREAMVSALGQQFPVGNLGKSKL